MCLYTDQMKPQIAKKDIKVYKVLNDKGLSICRFFEYIIGVEYTVELGVGIEYFDSGSTLATYSYVADIYDKSSRWRKVYRGVLREVSEGLHSCLFKRDKLVDLCEGEVWYNAIIPKGSEFYVSPLGDIVSNKLVVISKCD